MSVITWDAGAIPSGRPPARAVDRRGTGLRLTRRGRLVITSFALALAAAMTFSAQNATAGSGQRATEVVAHTVVAGDTLWKIAGTVAEPGQDRREVVDRIMTINAMSSSELVVGQHLMVPTR